MPISAFKVGQFRSLECKCGDIRHGFNIQITSDGQIYITCRACDEEMYLVDVVEVLNRFNEYE